MTMFRDERKPRVIRHNNKIMSRAFGARAMGEIPMVPVDMMSGRIEQADDRPTADSENPRLLTAAKAMVVAAVTSSALGMGVPAPRIGEAPAVLMAPDAMPRGKR